MPRGKKLSIIKFKQIIEKVGFKEREPNVYRKHLQEIRLEEKGVIFEFYDSQNDSLLSYMIPMSKFTLK